MKFTEYVLVKESDLEDLFVSENPAENIVLLHEMEYKMGKIIESKYSLNLKLYVNILKRFGNFAMDSYENLSPKFVELFEYWERIHSINDPKEWARNIMEEYGDDITMHKQAYMGGIKLTSTDILANLSEDSVRTFIEEYYDDDVLTFFEWNTGGFLNEKGIPVPPEEDEDYWDNNTTEGVEKIQELNLEDEFKEYIVQMIKDDPHILGEIELTDQMWENGIAEIMYPKYFAIHGKKIKGILSVTGAAKDRFSKADALADKGRAIINKMDVNDSSLDKDVDKLMEVVHSMTRAVSLAMNVSHSAGNLVTDYGGHVGMHDVDTDFLNDFNERDIEDWTEELRKIVKV